MRAAGIPLEVMWNDIHVYHAFRDLTSDPVSFPGDEMHAFVEGLHVDRRRYIPIDDAAVAHVVNGLYTSGAERDVFVKDPDGSEYVGQVWPSYMVFPDWFGERAGSWCGFSSSPPLSL
ncbi:glycoside hydrolase [Punctularia strigosozonata HHB-11173 SS5]|uniref:glycoside hydrolase n=1 Tax=Punctularia strigosozonata (strain HHB-11173) TaxID=741275 RepID=UPI0004417973|nr:glycoside hydrolase [Punctularia strigosozonata HHB-11173 SS5]EIN11646.1 glycoside hydrolase [Punctularia strigosozonata HHB-11173 SS5]